LSPALIQLLWSSSYAEALWVAGRKSTILAVSDQTSTGKCFSNFLAVPPIISPILWRTTLGISHAEHHPGHYGVEPGEWRPLNQTLGYLLKNTLNHRVICRSM
jgi:hypothetical protein